MFVFLPVFDAEKERGPKKAAPNSGMRVSLVKVRPKMSGALRSMCQSSQERRSIAAKALRKSCHHRLAKRKPRPRIVLHSVSARGLGKAKWVRKRTEEQNLARMAPTVFGDPLRGSEGVT